METQKITLTFVTPSGDQRAFEAAPGDTVMKFAIDHDVAGIAAECGGAMSCGTCHIILDAASFGRLAAPCEAETDMLDLVAAARQPTSRLSCQVRIDASLDGAVINIPECQF